MRALQLADGRRAVLRVFGRRAAPEWPRSTFFAAHAIPAPRLLAATAAGSPHEFVEGTRLGGLVRADERKDLPEDLHRRAREWLGMVLAYVAELLAHLERLRSLV